MYLLPVVAGAVVPVGREGKAAAGPGPLKRPPPVAAVDEEPLVSLWWIPVSALWLFLPAYIANMAPVFLAKLLPRWDAPMDGGRTRPDGTRILGAGKTWRGLFGGAVVASLFTVLMVTLLRFDDRLTDFGYAANGLWAPILLGFVLGLGALIGDAVKSYFKRKSGRPRGSAWIGPDQLDFVVGGLVFVGLAGLAVPEEGSTWTMIWLIHTWTLPVFLVIATPLLHWLVNVIGYLLKLKNEPW